MSDVSNRWVGESYGGILMSYGIHLAFDWCSQPAKSGRFMLALQN